MMFVGLLMHLCMCAEDVSVFLFAMMMQHTELN